MLKTILLSALLTFPQFAIFASPEKPQPGFANPVGSNESVILQLSQEKDFSALITETGLLLVKARRTNSFVLFKKAAANTATETELQQLAANLGFESVTGLKGFAARQQAQRAFLLKKYPQLVNVQQAGNIITAAIEANCELKDRIEKLQAQKLYPMSLCYPFLTFAQLCWVDPYPLGYLDSFQCWNDYMLLFELCLLGSEDF